MFAPTVMLMIASRGPARVARDRTSAFQALIEREAVVHPPLTARELTAALRMFLSATGWHQGQRGASGPLPARAIDRGFPGGVAGASGQGRGRAVAGEHYAAVGRVDEEYESFRRRDLSALDYVYVWVDGIHLNIRLEDDRLCLLVMIGASRRFATSTTRWDRNRGSRTPARFSAW